MLQLNLRMHVCIFSKKMLIKMPLVVNILHQMPVQKFVSCTFMSHKTHIKNWQSNQWYTLNIGYWNYIDITYVTFQKISSNAE